MTTSVRAATESDVEQLAEIGAGGFYADPVMQWVLRDDSARLDQLRMVFGQLATEFVSGGGRVDIAGDACMTLWRDPGFDHAAEPDGPVDAGEAGDGESPFDDETMERFGILTTLMAEAHPHDPHWYLFVVSTLPTHQGQGLGTAVIAPVLAEADAAGLPSYLESTNPRNMTLYRRLGFEQTGELALPDGPSLYPMWRDPR